MIIVSEYQLLMIETQISRKSGRARPGESRASWGSAQQSFSTASTLLEEIIEI